MFLSQISTDRVTDVPSVQDPMTFFRPSALRYVFGELCIEPGQRVLFLKFSTMISNLFFVVLRFVLLHVRILINFYT